MKIVEVKTGAGITKKTSLAGGCFNAYRMHHNLLILNRAFNDPELLLSKAKTNFINRIKNTPGDSILKLNVMYSEDFVLPTRGSYAVKAFNTQNRVIDNSTYTKL